MEKLCLRYCDFFQNNFHLIISRNILVRDRVRDGDDRGNDVFFVVDVSLLYCLLVQVVVRLDYVNRDAFRGDDGDGNCDVRGGGDENPDARGGRDDLRDASFFSYYNSTLIFCFMCSLTLANVFQ